MFKTVDFLTVVRRSSPELRLRLRRDLILECSMSRESVNPIDIEYQYIQYK